MLTKPKLYLEESSESVDFLLGLKKHSKLKQLSQEEWRFIESAYRIAQDAHAQQLRKNGKKYIVHPEGAILILLNELLSDDDIVNAEDIAALLCHDIIEDCPLFREKLYEFSPKLFWRVAMQSNLGKEEVRNYLMKKYSLETFRTMVDPILAYNFYGVYFPFWVSRILYQIRSPITDPEFYTYFSKQDWERRLNIGNVVSLPEIDLKARVADKLYNMRDSEYLDNTNKDAKQKFEDKLDFVEKVIIPRLKSLYLYKALAVLEESVKGARLMIR